MLTVGMERNTIEPAFRSTDVRKEMLMEGSPQLKEDINWQVTNEFAYKFVIFTPRHSTKRQNCHDW